jgi:hypothetical protein
VTAAMAAGTHIVCASHVGQADLDLTHEATIVDGRLSARALGRLSSDGATAEPRESSASAPWRERDCRPR